MSDVWSSVPDLSPLLRRRVEDFRRQNGSGSQKTKPTVESTVVVTSLVNRRDRLLHGLRCLE